MAHGASLREESGDPVLASHVMHDYRSADLSPRLRGILDFAVQLTSDPSSMGADHVGALKGLALTDEEVLSVVLITCAFNFVTRLADGLGVEVADEDQRQVEGWLSGPATEQEWLMTARA